MATLSLRNWKRRSSFRIRYGFDPPPPGTDFVGYEVLLDFMKRRSIASLPGDVFEIGVFCGGGTYTLAHFLKRYAPRKRVLAIDVFDVLFDKTENANGDEMQALYLKTLEDRSQYDVFCHVTRGLDNIVVFPTDSMKVDVGCEAACFGFIDGNHSPEYVVNDFYLVWSRLVPGGALAFHDYGHDLPGVTESIDLLRERHRPEISEFVVDAEKHVAFFRKRRD